MKKEAVVSCGSIKKGNEYQIIEEGEYYYRVRVQGRPICTYRWVFDR
jgi:hypothetical protein